MTKQEAKQKIAKLIEKYQNLVDTRKVGSYNEAQTRNEFIEPFFEFLGWDMRNLNNNGEVTTEENISGDRVDLAFRLGNIPVMFLEAKAMKVDLDEWKWAEQAINYSWNKSVTWAVLTDFESVKIFNAEIPPKGVSQNLFIEIRVNEYIERFDQLWLLSKEGFEQRLLDKEAEKWGKLTRRKQVGEKLFEDLMEWRGILTRDFKKNNNLTDDEVDEGVQRILDRLIFIRTAEDRKIERIVLQALLREWEMKGKRHNIYKRLIDGFRWFDENYNSKLFAPHYCEQWEADDKVFADVFKGLYETKDGYRYDFSAISADVLGGIYEQYLSYVQVRKSEEKSKSKRKSQGIYYTPRYIVEFIVKETLGEILKKTKPKDISNIKVLDPACGSGSFLTVAYDTILDKVKNQSLFTKFDILKDNIYGVDLDGQAVEIAQLNLLLKVLSQRTKLPTLQHNIKTGNSLVSGDPEKLEKYFGAEYREQKPFNFENEFTDVFKQDGFDVVIGNPPYVRPHNLEKAIKQYLWTESRTVKAKGDLYAAFIERGINLLREGGLMSFIVPHTWLSLESFEDLRKYVLDRCKIKSITFLPRKVFKDAQVETLIFVFEKCKLEKNRDNNTVLIYKLNEGENLTKIGNRKQKIYKESNIFDTSVGEELSVLDKINLCPTPLSDFVDFYYGLKTADDKKFLTFTPQNQKEYKKLIRRSDFSRYSINFTGEYVYYRPDLMRKNKTTARPGEPERFEGPKIIIMDIAKKIVSTYDEQGYYVKDALILKPKEKFIDLRYIVALLNSKLINFFYKHKYKVLSVAKNAFMALPIKFDPTQKDIINQAQTILSLEAILINTPKSTDKFNSLKQEIEKLDRKIDQEVYRLYELTDGEIAIIERSLVIK